MGNEILKCAARTTSFLQRLKLGGKSPNIYFEDVLDYEDDYLNKCAEGLLLGFFNQVKCVPVPPGH